jgi:aspartyl/asparaginyl beta-hydroxylase (cupin superfamily)
VPPPQAVVEQVRELNRSAMKAMAGGALADAAALLEQAGRLDPAATPVWLNLAACRRGLDQVDAALSALEQALSADPRNFMALLMKASLLERQGKARQAATAYGVALTQAPPDSQLDAATLKAVQRARELNGRHVAELEAFVRAELAEPLAQAPALEARRMEAFIDIRLGRRRRFVQQPVEFFYPGLPAIEIYDRSLFPWLSALEAETDAVRAELQALLAEGDDGFTPYIQYPDSVPLDQWAELNQSRRWGAFHLIAYGQTVAANAARCPRTMAAVGQLPQPQLPGRAPAAMFSNLQPKTRIPPHTGIANVRLVTHLPLIVPAGCGFRVGGETREWKPGVAWVFDDTIEHEAWNDSGETRVILICDVWSPYLSETERVLIAQAMRAMDTFNDAPRGPSI